MNEIFMPRPNGPVPIKGVSFVIVGANGAGKSQLGAWIEEHGKGARQSHRISAQRALTFQEFIEPLARERAERRLYFGADHEGAQIAHRRGSRWGNDPVGHLLNDFDALLASLWAQESERDATYVKDTRASACRDKLEVPDSRLETLKRIWHDLLPHRQLRFDGGKVMASIIDKPDHHYHGRHMSDGERVIVYLIGQAMCAPRDALLIIDEPEIHLHRAIRDKLWDSIELARPDCVFVFITHDLEFAACRDAATIVWVRGFDGSKQHPEWDWDLCPTDLELPSELLLQVLGSRKPVLFVEGDNFASLDAKLYKIIYPTHRVIAVGSGTNVDRCVTALSAVPSLHHVKPQGIVDRDHRAADEIAALGNRGVTCCSYAEIENLLMDERVVSAVALRAGVSDSSSVVQKVKVRVLEKLKNERDRQSAQWGEAVVARRLAGFSCKETDATKVAAAVEAHAKAIDVAGTYAEARSCIDKAISAADYVEALRLFNQKGLVAVASGCLSIPAEAYQRMALAALREDATLRGHIAAMVPLGA